LTTLVVEGPEKPLHSLLPVTTWRSAPGAAPCGKLLILVRNHALDLFLIGLIQNRIRIELALALGALGSQDVALKRVSALDFAGTCLLEALRRSAVCL
jgi:hypothetical protein